MDSADGVDFNLRRAEIRLIVGLAIIAFDGLARELTALRDSNPPPRVAVVRAGSHGHRTATR